MGEKITDYKMIIDGEFVDSKSGVKIQIECPSNKAFFARKVRHSLRQ